MIMDVSTSQTTFRFLMFGSHLGDLVVQLLEVLLVVPQVKLLFLGSLCFASFRQKLSDVVDRVGDILSLRDHSLSTLPPGRNKLPRSRSVEDQLGHLRFQWFPVGFPQNASSRLEGGQKEAHVGYILIFTHIYIYGHIYNIIYIYLFIHDVIYWFVIFSIGPVLGTQI